MGDLLAEFWVGTREDNLRSDLPEAEAYDHSVRKGHAGVVWVTHKSAVGIQDYRPEDNRVCRTAAVEEMMEAVPSSCTLHNLVAI